KCRINHNGRRFRRKLHSRYDFFICNNRLIYYMYHIYFGSYFKTYAKKMRKYLFILFCLPLFAQVPDTNTFSFTDVKDEIEDNGGATTNSLVDAFTNANASGFDPAYEGSKNSL